MMSQAPLEDKNMIYKLTVAISGIVVMVISTLTIIGYWIDSSGFYQWYGEIGMALNTAVCFWLVGLSQVFVATYSKKD